MIKTSFCGNSAFEKLGIVPSAASEWPEEASREKVEAMLSSVHREHDVFRCDDDVAPGRFDRERERFGDRAFHEWSASKMIPETLLQRPQDATPEIMFPLCIRLSQSLAERFRKFGASTAIFSVSMTPASEDLPTDSFSFRFVTGADAVSEFGKPVHSDELPVLIVTITTGEDTGR